jgi:hydroxyacylglutathione hydrolase
MIDVRMFTVGPVQENCFVVRAPEGADRAVIVDPGDEADRLLEALEALGIETVEAILLTHTHFDHIGAVAPVARATGAPGLLPELETEVLAEHQWTTCAGPASARSRATRPTTRSRAARRSSSRG